MNIFWFDGDTFAVDGKVIHLSKHTYVLSNPPKPLVAPEELSTENDNFLLEISW